MDPGPGPNATDTPIGSHRCPRARRRPCANAGEERTYSDAQYQAWDTQLAACQALRQPLATDIDRMLSGASFGGGFDTRAAWSDLLRAEVLLRDVQGLEHAAVPPSHIVCSTRRNGARGPWSSGSHRSPRWGSDRGAHKRGR